MILIHTNGSYELKVTMETDPAAMMTTGERLRAEREARGYSRARLSELTGVGQNSIAKYELAGSPEGQYPPLGALVRLAYVLELDPRRIFDDYLCKNAETPDSPKVGKGLHDVVEAEGGFFSFHRHWMERELRYGSFHLSGGALASLKKTAMYLRDVSLDIDSYAEAIDEVVRAQDQSDGGTNDVTATAAKSDGPDEKSEPPV